MDTKETKPIFTVTSFDKTTPEYQLMGDFYKLFRVLYQVNDNDKFYEQAIALFDEFYEKYKGNDIKEHFDDAFITDLTSALGAFIDRKAAAQRNAAKENSEPDLEIL